MHTYSRKVYCCSSAGVFVKFDVTEDKIKTRGFDPLVAGLLVFGLIVRVLFHIQYSNSIFWGDLSIDELLHDAWARYIADGNIIGNEVFFRAPLYPYFLALLYKLSGANLHVVLLIQHAIGLLSGWLLYRTGKELVSHNTGVLALILYSLTPIFVYFESQLLLDFLIIPFALLSFFLLKRAIDRESIPYLIACGLSIGLTALVRPNILAFVPFVIIWLIIIIAENDGLKRAIARAAILTASIAIMISPVTVRNYVVGDDLVLISSQGGINFYLGNNEEATGLSAYMPDLGYAWDYTDCEYIAEKEMGQDLKPSEISDYWYDRGLHFVLDKSEQFVPLIIKKAYHLINNHEISNNRSIPYVFDEAWILSILPIGLWFILPLALIGIVHGFKNRWIKLLGLFIAVYSFTLLMFFINSRFRIPILAVALILAAYGIEQLVELIIKRQYIQFVICGVFFVAAALFTDTNFYNSDFDDRSFEEFNIGNRLFETGDYESALERYHSALASQPGTSQINLNIGNIQMKLGNLDSARIYYQRELEVTPDSTRAYNNLSVIERLSGNDSLSIEYSERVLSTKPYFTDAVVNYIITCRHIGAHDRALAAANKALEYESNNPELYYYRGVILFDHNQLSEALADFTQAERLISSESIQPSFSLQNNIVNITSHEDEQRKLESKIKYSIGTIKGRTGDTQAAIDYLKSSLDLDPSLTEARTNLASALVQAGRFSEALEQTEAVIPDGSAGALTWYLNAVSQANLGNVNAALESLDSALSITPEFAPAINLKELISNQKETGED